MTTVTPAMLKAGTEALSSYYKDSTLDGVYAEAAVRAVWVAMEHVAPRRTAVTAPTPFIDHTACYTFTVTQGHHIVEPPQPLEG